LDVRIEIVKRQGLFIDVQFVDRQFVRQRQRDLGEFDGEGHDVEAVELLAGDEAERLLLPLALAGGFGDAFDKFGFEAFEFSVGDVQEVARAAGGIEHLERVQALLEGAELRKIFRLRDRGAPRMDDGGADDLHDVGGRGVMPAVLVSLGVVHGVLEDGAEDVG